MKYKTCNICKKRCIINEYDYELIRECAKLFAKHLEKKLGCSLTVQDLIQGDKCKERMQTILKFYLTTEEICEELGVSEKVLWNTLRKCLGWGPPNKWKHFRQFDIMSSVWRHLYGVEWRKKK